MRTPWVLSSLDQDSAFVGLGMSIDRKAAKGNQVILGCSHLYNSQRQGLQFRLSKIENPVIRRKNAFMWFDDARRVGETIRQLFWESAAKVLSREAADSSSTCYPTSLGALGPDYDWRGDPRALQNELEQLRFIYETACHL